MVRTRCQFPVRIQPFVQTDHNRLRVWWQRGGKILAVFFRLVLHCLYFLRVSGFGSSFLPKEESVTAAPEVEVSEDYQASSQVGLYLNFDCF